MPQPGGARQQLDLAERAAIAGDLAAAREFLTNALRIQEVELGPQHPDLISTLSNLAIIAERTGRSDDAAAGYRQVAALASAALPPDHEMVVESRRNLEAFCREHGLEASPLTAAPVPAELAVTKPDPVAKPVARESSAPVQPRSLGPMLWLGFGAAIVAVVVLVQISNSRPTNQDTSTLEAAVQPTSPQPVTSPSPATETPRAPAPERNEPAATAASGNAQPSFAATPPAAIAPVPSGSEASIVTAQLCRQFSATGASWQCDPPTDPAIPGSTVLYTRIRSARDAAVVHRWYRGDVLRQSVRLTVRANTSEGFRTYSRHTVDTGDWRVEVRSADGDLLHEQSFSVR